MILNNIYNNVFKVDIRLVILYLLISCIGLFSIFYIVETRSKQEILILFTKNIFTRQLLWFIISMSIGIIIMLTNYKYISSFSYPFFISMVALMLITVFVGTEVRGSRSWLNVLGMNIQIVEICKIATVLGLSKYLAHRGKNRKNIWYYFRASLFIFSPFLLSILQEEIGISITFMALFIVLYRAGLSPYILILPVVFLLITILCLTTALNKILIIMGIIVVSALIFRKYIIHFFYNKFLFYFSLPLLVAVVFLTQQYAIPFIFQKSLKTYQVTRIVQLFGIENVNKNILFSKEQIQKISVKDFDNYNVSQSKIAIGAGSFLGRGLEYSTQTSMEFVPEQSTDFIFCFISEAFGFLGSIIFLLLIFLLVVRIFYLAEKQRSPFATYVGYGLGSLLLIQYVINLSMTMGIFPVIGLTLPFVSYGGSSFVSFSILFFIFLRLNNDRKNIIT